MENKSFLTTFISVLAATLFFYGISAGGALAVNNVFSFNKDFGNQSYVGSFNVSNLKEQAAREQLSTDFTGLWESYQVDLFYQDAVAELPVEAVVLELDQTIENAETGIENPIKATVSEDSLRTVLNQQFSPVTFSDEDVLEITAGIEKKLETGIMPTQVYISDFMAGTEFSEIEVAQSSLTITAVSPSMTKVIQALNGTEIEAFSTFSLLDFIESEELGIIPNDELTAIASVLYSTIMPTNFAVDERYIGETLHQDVPIGYEAAVNQNLGIGFIFTNPNQSSFTLNIDSVGQNLSASLTGLPLIYTYEIGISNVELFKPRTIEEYSSFVAQGSKQVKQQGRNGQEVIVTRNVFHRGLELEHSQISKDFYAPIHQIEVLPLIPVDKPAGETTDGGTSSTAGNTDGNTGTTTPGSTDGNTGTTRSGSTKPSDGTTTQKDSVTDDKTDVQYDKGGNIIN